MKLGTDDLVVQLMQNEDVVGKLTDLLAVLARLPAAGGPNVRLKDTIGVVSIDRAESLGRPVPEVSWTGDELRLVHDTFNLIDTDGNDSIDRQELKIALANFGKQLSQGEMDSLFRTFDRDGIGEIHFSEFTRLVQQHGFLQNLVLKPGSLLDRAGSISSYARETIARWIQDDGEAGARACSKVRITVQP